MESSAVNAESAPVPEGGYVQALQVAGAQRWLFVSGQIPQDRDGRVPADFEGQCRLVWEHVVAEIFDPAWLVEIEASAAA